MGFSNAGFSLLPLNEPRYIIGVIQKGQNFLHTVLRTCLSFILRAAKTH